MIDNLFDLLDIVPESAVAGSIPYYDWCDWTTVVLPSSGLNTCTDVQNCIDNAFLLSILQVDSSLSVSWWVLSVNETRVNSIIDVVRAAPNLTIGNTTVDLSDLLSAFSLTFNDWSNSFSVSNLDTVQVEWLDWMRFLATAPNRLQVGLPAWAAHMQVLTWDDDQQVAIWNNNQCCAQTLSFDTATNVLSISGTNSVDLTSINTDNQELELSGNILSITQLNSWPQAVDLTNVNEHTISLTNNILSIIGSDGVVNATVDLLTVWPKTLDFDDANNEMQLKDDNWNVVSHVNIEWANNQTLEVQTWPDACVDWWVEVWITQPDWTTQRVDIPKAPVQCCDDVEACPAIQTMKNDIAAQWVAIAQMQTQIETIQAQLP